jgi:5-methylcytosine-specific restriction endonuclease McrBC regulatory subunit McrC
MKIYFEGDKIEEYIGDDASKLKFLTEHAIEVNFSKTYTQFFCTGIFQITGGPPLIILPWFLKGNISVLDGNIASSELSFFDFIKKIKYYLDSGVHLYGKSGTGLAWEIVCHSFLKKVESFLTEIIKHNYFVDTEDVTNSIKGKWSIATDLRKNPKPLKFTCSYSTVGKETFELAVIKSALLKISRHVRVMHNKELVNSLLKILEDVIPVDLNPQSLWKLKSQNNVITRHSSWDSIIEFLESWIDGKAFQENESGISFKLPVDKFFEDLMFFFLRKVPDISCEKQIRRDILGGCSWISENGDLIEEEAITGKAYSIPDIILKNDSSLSIVECKYKPLSIPFINTDFSDNLQKFSRNDRNQLLSFVLAVSPSIDIGNRKVSFNVIYPCSQIESIKSSILSFPNSKFAFNSFSKNLIHRNFRDKLTSEDVLKFHFVGVNVSKALSSIRNGDAHNFATELVQQLVQKDLVVSDKKSINLREERIKKRVALSSLIVSDLSNDKTLGRTKMAKIIFMADSICNLDLGLSYERAAAGPLDYDSIVNQKHGIEALADKNAFFKTIRAKRSDEKTDRFTYTPSANISKAKELADQYFIDSVESIHDIVSKLKPLNTEQTEIIATLFACWNDLLARGKDPTDEEIISDFINNWHESKKRFTDKQEVLITWLNNMRRWGLKPSGLKVITKKVA